MARLNFFHALVGLGCWITAVSAQMEFPDPENFIRAGFWQGTVIGNYIYLDGGEMSRESSSEIYDPINVTYSIDCSKSWSPEDVKIREIPKDSPIKSLQAIITDQNTNSFYIWGGYSMKAAPDDPGTHGDLWRFTADGEGGGDWDTEAVTNGDVYNDSVFTTGPAFASSKDMGFIIGGTQMPLKGPRENADGFKTLNFTTMEWQEDTETSYPNNNIFSGSAVFVEEYGASGILVVLGGITKRGENGAAHLPVERAYIYDIAATKWHFQDILSPDNNKKPARWDRACAIAVADTGDNNSVEIFIYGGGQDDASGGRDEYGTIYALSLPGFFWTKVASDDRRRRSNHACVTLGNNQLVSLGGTVHRGKTEDTWAYRDPIPRGIGIFNMNNHSWQEFYDADADGYVTHESIKAWYDDGGLDGVPWENDDVRALFVESNESTSPTPVGAIVGGVIGGVAGIAIVGAAVWLFLRKRRRSHESPTAPPEAPLPAEASPYAQVPAEAPTETKLSPNMIKSQSPMLDGREMLGEMPGSALSELPEYRRAALGSPIQAPVSELEGSNVR